MPHLYPCVVSVHCTRTHTLFLCTAPGSLIIIKSKIPTYCSIGC
ncbi:hypothetical protein U0070_006574 [Myodes glareolus]|uniref:Uncharacterized protein n=1 Tax=Myodes glareolus TaxID=447135 RepID=A0AAW0J5U9_MYOGA